MLNSQDALKFVSDRIAEVNKRLPEGWVAEGQLETCEGCGSPVVDVIFSYVDGKRNGRLLLAHADKGTHLFDSLEERWVILMEQKLEVIAKNLNASANDGIGKFAVVMTPFGIMMAVIHEVDLSSS